MASFDRKVERNQAKLMKKGKNPNQHRGTVRLGTGSTPGPKGDGDIFRGRKIILPFLLILLAGMYSGVASMSGSAESSTTLFWITIALYFILAIALFLNRPYLRINKSYLFSAKFNRDRTLEASQVSKITIYKHKIEITPKMTGPKWVFYKKRNLFDTDAMAARLEEYAHTYKVELVKK